MITSEQEWIQAILQGGHHQNKWKNAPLSPAQDFHVMWSSKLSRNSQILILRQWRSQSLPGWASRPPGSQNEEENEKSLRKSKKIDQNLRGKMRKVELSPTHDCEVGYGPVWDNFLLKGKTPFVFGSAKPSTACISGTNQLLGFSAEYGIKNVSYNYVENKKFDFSNFRPGVALGF